jgi:8-oxo-dGTP pyrophosphatase MutT (NUDIX family)
MTCYEALRQELNQPLPGEDYQVKMAPLGRFIPAEVAKIKSKAAVALILYESFTNSKIELILTKRNIYDGPHSGQVSFPGGKTDPEDNTLIDTAIRETEEEIGLKLMYENYLGKLTPLHIMVSGFEVHPFVFFYPSVPNFKLDPKEVQFILKVSLEKLTDDTIIKETVIDIRGLQIRTPYFDISEEIVWGATSMMLSEFIEVLRRVQSSRRKIK